MSEQIKVERVLEYSDEVAAGIGKLMPYLNPEFSHEPVSEERLKAIIESSDREQFVALLHGKIVGAATLNIIVGIAGEKAWLEDFVAPGAGYPIWQEMLEWCREKGVNKLGFTSSPTRKEAHSFYTRQGAKIYDTKVFYVDINLQE
jgi:hypothetical protein